MSDKQEIRVSGSNRLTDINCSRLKASGSTVVDGYLKSDVVNVSGSTTVNGELTGDVIDASGSFEVSGRIDVGNLTSSGSFKASKPSKIDNLEASGSAKFDDIEGEHLTSTGSLIADRIKFETVDIKGSVEANEIEADKIEIDLRGESTVDRIKGGDVVVESPDSKGFLGFNLGILGKGKKGGITAQEISGREIHLEHTSAEKVEGERVYIGPECEIGEVEADELEIDETAEVKTQKS